MSGFFKVYREIFQHETFKNEVDFRLFMLILGNAVFAEEGVEKGGVHIGRGQWVRSYRQLSKDLEYKEKRGYKQYGLATIKRSIQRLFKNGLVSFSDTEIGTLFKVENYEEYQGFSDSPEQDTGTVNGTKSERHRNNNKNVLKDVVVDVVVEDEQEPENDIQPEKANEPTEDIFSPDQPESNDDYDQVQTLYLQRAGKMMLSGSDMEAISQLLDSEQIPLQTILDGIKQAFDNYKPRYPGDSINSFSYCVKAIRSLHHQLEQRKAWNQRKKKRRYSPPIQQKPNNSDLPEVFRQQEKEPKPEMSPEEMEAKKKAILEKLKMGPETIPPVKEARS